MAVELFPEELVGVSGGGKEVQAVWRVRPTDVACVDLQDAVPGPGLSDEVGQRLVLVGDVLEGLRDELIEIVAVGDLLLDVEDGQLELLQKAVLILLFPLCEVEKVAGVCTLTWLMHLKLLRPCACRQVCGVWCGHDERLLCRDEV